MFAPLEIMWALIGLILTIGGTFLEASIASPSWNVLQEGIPIYSLGVTYQVGAVLLVGCLGGKNAGALSQIAYLVLGLLWLPVFTHGGGLDYIKQPTFGYLLGFIPGAWVCGWLAFKLPPRLEFLAASSLLGLLCVHAIGLLFLVVIVHANQNALANAAIAYSVYPLPGQLAVVCAVSVVAFILRTIMFY
ncbi:biotin transporter BioY [Phormidium sp. CCY1219]|uniref:biotin transporter BioY n=1 Tax=Phormidium sp. CCY1219 TaxID=2886104 RepID=UPI002D1F6F57|nr:biotin transporter BioY [Phormidium sp. CCY1219]MEB3830071.1 biotin transporter BioY [Phormidium sp. CCY1219]